MSNAKPENSPGSEDPKNNNSMDNTAPAAKERPKEIGGRGGLDPTRYGDWEKAGRCVDF